MELKEIKAVCKVILERLTSSPKGMFYCKYETFLDDFDMLYKRNSGRIKQIDRQLKKHHVTFWVGREKVESVGDIKRGVTITFRLESRIENGSPEIVIDNDTGKKVVKQ